MRRFGCCHVGTLYGDPVDKLLCANVNSDDVISSDRIDDNSDGRGDNANDFVIIIFNTKVVIFLYFIASES